MYGDADHDNCTIEYGYQRPYYNTTDNIRTGSVSVSTPGNVEGSSFGQSMSVTVNTDARFNNDSYYSVYAKITDPSGASAIDTAQVTYVAHVTKTSTYKCTVECWKKEWDTEGYVTNKPITRHVKVTSLVYPINCEGIYVFANIGDGTDWIYKSSEVDFWNNSKPTTIDLTPYTTFSHTFTYSAAYKPVTVTITDQKAAGTVNTVAVSFPDTVGESHKNTYTFEWN